MRRPLTAAPEDKLLDSFLYLQDDAPREDDAPGEDDIGHQVPTMDLWEEEDGRGIKS